MKTAAVFLLLFNTAGALYGGYNLMRYPDGSSIGLPLWLLQQSCFDNFLIPGIILFVGNGLYGLFVCAAVLRNSRRYSLFVTIQGVILTGWIVIQVLLIRTFSPFQLILGTVGLLLIAFGLLVKHDDSPG